ERLAGDGLVPLFSALGSHRSPKRNMGLPESRRWIAYKTNHLDLLASADAYARISAWLSSAPQAARIAAEERVGGSPHSGVQVEQRADKACSFIDFTSARLDQAPGDSSPGTMRLMAVPLSEVAMPAASDSR